MKSDLHDSMSRRLAFSELHNASGSIHEVIYLSGRMLQQRVSHQRLPNNGDFNPSWIKCFGTAYSGLYTFSQWASLTNNCIQVRRKSIHHSIQRSLICEYPFLSNLFIINQLIWFANQTQWFINHKCQSLSKFEESLEGSLRFMSFICLILPYFKGSIN